VKVALWIKHSLPERPAAETSPIGQHFASNRTVAEPWADNEFVAQQALVSARQVDHISGLKRFNAQFYFSAIPVSPSQFAVPDGARAFQVVKTAWRVSGNHAQAGASSRGGIRDAVTEAKMNRFR
jgi:hypothetical protein